MRDGNQNEDADEYPSPSEQYAFSQAYDILKEAIESGEHDPVEVGKGILIAGLCGLRKSLSNEEIAEIFYRYADDYAVKNFNAES